MDRAQLIAENEKLLARRQAIERPKQIEPYVQSICLEETDGAYSYIVSLRNGEAVDNPKEVIAGCRAKWDSFNDDRHPDLAKGVKVIKQWYNDGIGQGRSLLIAGGFGCGKTHLAKAIRDLYGYRAIYWNELDLFKTIQSGYKGDGRGRSEESIFSEANRAELLIYDDLGVYETDNTDWVRRNYLSLFDARWEQDKPILLTTNLNCKGDPGSSNEYDRPEILNWLGGRLYSRLFGALGDKSYYVDLFEVPDYRLKGF